MADLIAIGYDDERTAARAADAVYGMSEDLAIQPDAVAVIVRDAEGRYQVTTNHHPVGAGATWGMFWGMLFGVLFFIPVFGMAVGAGLGALLGKVETSGIETSFQRQVRDLLAPGTSALFLVVENVSSDQAVDGLGAFGGTVLKSSLTDEAKSQLQSSLHGDFAVAS